MKPKRIQKKKTTNLYRKGSIAGMMALCQALANRGWTEEQVASLLIEARALMGVEIDDNTQKETV